jgi:hypothetical protein
MALVLFSFETVLCQTEPVYKYVTNPRSLLRKSTCRRALNAYLRAVLGWMGPLHYLTTKEQGGVKDN